MATSPPSGPTAGNRRLPRFAIPLALAMVSGDQATKWWVRSTIDPLAPIPVIPGFFDLVHIGNTGAAFGAFKGGNAFFIALALGALALLGCLAYHRFFTKPIMAAAFGLLAGGILGNLADRIRLGHVTDFLDVYVGDWHWPAFNVADSCICIAALLLAWCELTRGAADPPATAGRER